MNALVLLAQTDAYSEFWEADRFLGGVVALGGLFLVLAAVASAFWLWMLVDVLVSSKPANEKILWFLVVFFLHFLGALVYFLVGRSPATRAVRSAGLT